MTGSQSRRKLLQDKLQDDLSEPPLGGFRKGLTSSHFQMFKETKTSEVLRKVLERFQVPRGFSEVFGFYIFGRHFSYTVIGVT